MISRYSREKVMAWIHATGGLVLGILVFVILFPTILAFMFAFGNAGGTAGGRFSKIRPVHAIGLTGYRFLDF